MTVEKPKQLLRPIIPGTNSSVNQSQFPAITCNSPEAREKSREHDAIGFGFGFASHWSKNWRESFKPITKSSNRNHVITFDSHLKTALCKFVTFLSPFSSWLLKLPEFKQQQQRQRKRKRRLKINI